MAKKRWIDTKFWTDTFVINELDPLEKLVYLYLITSPQSNICGIYELPIKVMAVETGIEKDNLSKVILPRLEKAGKIKYMNGWVAIRNFIKHQNQKSPKVLAGIENELENAPKNLVSWVKNKRVSEGIDTLSHLDSDLDIDLDSDSDTTAQSAGNTTNAFISLFKEINPSYEQLFKRPPQRAAADRLLKLHDFDWWQKFIPAYAAALEDRYCPRATTPIRLEEKLGDIEHYGRSKRAEKIKGGNNFVI